MKRIIKSLSIIGAIIAIMVIGINCIKKPCDPPQKISNIPEKAFWVGGCDGGLWYELISFQNDIYKFKIYNDVSGDIIVDGNFKATGSCFNMLKNENSIQTLITHSTKDKIYLSLKDNNSYCFLQKIPD